MSTLTIPFLTDLDAREAVKGSRDPLGIQPIWTRFGRQVVGNLTTVSTSVTDFATTILGHYFIERVRAVSEEDDDLGVFLRWEQLAAYARAHVNGDISFRGTDRARLQLQESFVRLSDDRAYQILSNQKTYGLWGLYTVPSRASGLLEGEPVRLSRAAREFIEREYLPRLAKAGFADGRALVDKLRAPTRLDHQGRDAKLLAAVAGLLDRELSARERSFFHEHLVLGGPENRTNGVQAELAQLLSETLDDEGFYFSTATVDALARKAGDRTILGERLTRIRHCESFLAPASLLFNFALSWNEAPVADIANVIRQQWGPASPVIQAQALPALRAELAMATGSAEAADRWLRIGRVLAEGDYAAVIRLLVEQNSHVMAARGGSAPWTEVREGRLHVRIHGESGDLPGQDELPDLWRHPYFMVSLREVARAVQESR